MGSAMLALLLVVLGSSSLLCWGSPAVGLVRTRSSLWSATFCAVYNSHWGDIASSDKPATWYAAEEASDPDVLACSPQTMAHFGGAIVSLRGNCSFCEKAHYAESANASLLLVVYNESNLLVEPVCGRGDPTPSIPVLLVSNESGWDILSTLSLTNLTLAPFAPPPATFDPAVIVTLLIAVVTVVLGSYIANTPFDFLRYGLLVRKGERYGETHRSEREASGKKTVAMTLLAILAFLVLICTMLLLLYYFYYPMVYIVIAVYCVGASVGLFCLLSPLVALIPLMKNVRLPVNKVPVLEYRPDPRFPLTVLLCVSVTVWWLLERHSVYGWVLQDFLGFAFLTYILSRMLFLPTWVVAIAMVFLFFYDIIMVFITPFLTEDHSSVMVKAATGGGGSVEPLPIVFVVPKLLSSALDQTCSDLTGYFPFSLLGYGDVGVPGLLVALCLKFDMTHRSTSKYRLYFGVASLAYTLGLGATMVALILMKTAQPALLYLVPTTLGSIILLSLCRGEFRLFFTEKAHKRRTHVQDNTAAVETDTDNSEGEKETLIN